MCDADEYRQFAEQCLKQADEVESEPQRKACLEMALTWSRLAEEASRSNDNEVVRHGADHAQGDQPF